MLSFLTESQIDSYLPRIASIYRNGFILPPYSKPESEIVDFSRSLPGQTSREGFRFLGAFEGDDTKNLVGFTYGYATRAGKWWLDAVKPALAAPMVEYWLEDSYELVEIVVEPQFQGRGIGSLLHDRLLSEVPNERAVLSTLQADTVASRLYRSRGWVTLLEDFFFPGVERRYKIMGKELITGSKTNDNINSPPR